MTVKRFPPVEYADEYGLLAVGGDVEVDTLLLAYRSGIFPWPMSGRQLTWFAPPSRALLFFDKLHISKSLKRTINKQELQFSFDSNFETTIHECAEAKNRTGQRGTWITPEMISGYIALYEAGYAHSIEAYRGDDLVGGVYGVSINGLFAAESMFYREPNASKLALFHLMEHLRLQGVGWIDCQVMTPLTKAFGAIEVPREAYMKLLSEALKKPEIKF